MSQAAKPATKVGDPDVASLRQSISPAVSTVRITYPDLHGDPARQGRADRRVRAHARAAGLSFCWAVMGTDLRHTPVVGGEEGYPDMVARPDLSTLSSFPGSPTSPAASPTSTATSEPEPTDQRGARAPRRGGARRARPHRRRSAPSSSSSCCEPDGEGGWRRHVDNLSMVYTVGPQADPQGIFRSRCSRPARQLGIGAIAANHEFMNSQYEINLREATPLDAADNAFRFKAAVKDYAAQRGLLATFMGKPFNDQGGSGIHLHISLERDGRELLRRPRRRRRPLDRAAPFRRRHPRARAGADGVPEPDDQRLPPDPARQPRAHHVNWGLDNRTTFVRIPPERGGGCRLEIRVGDGAANPHLVIAAILSPASTGSGASSIRRRRSTATPTRLPEPSRASRCRRRSPRRLDALEADEVLRDAVGAEIVDTFLAMKRFELERYRLHVSDWELDRVHAPPLMSRTPTPTRSRRSRSTTSTSPTTPSSPTACRTRCSLTAAPRGPGALAGGGGRPRLLGGHQARRHHRTSTRTGRPSPPSAAAPRSRTSSPRTSRRASR